VPLQKLAHSNLSSVLKMLPIFSQELSLAPVFEKNDDQHFSFLFSEINKVVVFLPALQTELLLLICQSSVSKKIKSI